jgi:hypothetical protein
MHKEWKPARGKYASGEELWIGDNICVGSWFNPTISKGEDTKYRASINLPSIAIKAEFVDHADRDRAKAVVERVVDRWFQRATGAPKK